MSSPIHWPAEAIWESVAPELPGFSVEILPQVDSTNSELMRRAHAERIEPVLLVAQQQTAGRGRLGREWVSDAQAVSSLTFSLGLPLSPLAWSGLSLAVGVSVAQSLHPQLRLKWPNDLWLHDRKLGGILIETANWSGGSAARYAVVGVGLNIRAPEAQGLRTPPAWLGEVLASVDAPQALLRIVAPLVQAIKQFESAGFGQFQKRFNDRDALGGLCVTLSDGTSGIAQGVDADGALLVETDQGLKKVTNSEVSVRPLTPPSYENL